MKATQLLRILVLAIAFGAMVGLSSASTVAAAAPPGPFFQGFEVDNSGWNVLGGQYDAVRVSSGMHGITSKTGSYHAEAYPLDTLGGSAFTRWGGYSSVFPAVGYITALDIYLDVNTAAANDTRFDFTSAINDNTGAFHRDFVFNGGFYNDSDTTGSGNRFVISASNNAGRGGAFPKNPGRTPIAITTSGWYTFQHHFRDNSGVLAVDLSIVDSSNAVIHTWTLSDPTDTMSIIGGNRYGWFASNEFSFLAIDNTKRTSFLGACAVSISDSTITLLSDCTTDQTIFVPNGFTLDGAGHTITAVDPAGGHFLGAVIMNTVIVNAVANVKNLGVTASGLIDACDAGNDRLRGILFDGAAGSITNNTVTHIKQGVNSGCQEGNGIEVRNAPFDNTGNDLNVLISGNTVSDYQKNGITANGSVAATITGNTVTGAGQINYIAQNGIQIGFGGTATVMNNTASGNYYTPISDVACGILYYQADGVKASKNTEFANERDVCNFGKGGGTFNPSP